MDHKLESVAQISTKLPKFIIKKADQEVDQKCLRVESRCDSCRLSEFVIIQTIV